MKILHTSDWHVGKMLRGMPRLDEHRAVLGEIADIAARERVDLVLVVGDLFETAAPPPEAQAVVWDALLALRASGAAVVVVGGNHDQQAQLDAVAPVFAQLGIHVVGLPSLEHGVADIAGARVVMLPWVSQRWAIKSEQLMGATAAATAQYYAARVARLLAHLSEGFAVDTVNIVAAHCMVQGGMLGGGERDAQQLIDEYLVPAAAFPAAANYVALGHLHRTQNIAGAAPIWYCGSPIQVDFGEEKDTKHVLVVDIPDRGAAKVTPVPLTAGWTLRTVRGTYAELEAIAAKVGDAWLRVEVREAARPGLADDVRAMLPNAVDVRIAPDVRPDDDAPPPVTRAGVQPRELFGSFLDLTNVARDERLLALFDELLDAETAGTT